MKVCLGQSFIFFVLRTLSTQLFENLKKEREIFSILFLNLPPTHACTVLEFNYVVFFVFSTAARLIKVPQ